MDSVYVKTNVPATAHLSLSRRNQQVYDLRISLPAVKYPVLSSPLEKKHNKIIKRSFDIIVSLFFIIAFLSWLVPLFALLIKLDSRGPVFFRQKRNRNAGRLFSCLKFRTMHLNDDADLVPAQVNDKRVTRVGRFLRRHYLDELPQFINVLMGDMSIIGPRPHMVSDNIKYEKLVKNYAYRHHIKPGITGLAQVRGYAGHVTNVRTMEARVAMDIFYMKHWSARFDILILYRTFFKSLGI